MISRSKVIRHYSAFTLILASLVGSQSAQATFVMTLDDLNDSTEAIQIVDSRPWSPAGSDPGVFAFSGMVGNFDVNVIAGISRDANGGRVLNLNNISATSSSAGSLAVRISDWFNSGNFYMANNSYPALTHLEGTTQGTVTFSALQQSAALATGTLTSVFNQSTNTYLPHVSYRDSTAPFEISLRTEITHGLGMNATNFSASISPSPVPLPAGIWLLISALSGGFLIRRKQ